MDKRSKKQKGNKRENKSHFTEQDKDVKQKQQQKLGSILKDGKTEEKAPNIKQEPAHCANEVDETASSKFSRRKIINNWNKYEPPETDEEPNARRGADFEALLQSTGGDFFRFKDELEWETTKDEANNDKDFFLLDCEDLGKAMLCVPLHSRLMIKKEHFPPKLVAKFEKLAKENCLQYNCVTKLNTSAMEEARDAAADHASTSVHVEPSNRLTNYILPISSDSSIDVSSVISSEKLAQNRKSDGSEISNEIDKRDKKGNTGINVCVPKPCVKEIIEEKIDVDSSRNEENELDFLLSLTATNNMPEIQHDTEQNKSISKETNNNPSSEVKLFPDTKKTATADSLDSWLDEMLQE